MAVAVPLIMGFAAGFSATKAALDLAGVGKPKPKTPKVPKPIDVPEPAPPPDVEAGATQAGERAAQQRKKRAAGATGRRDTILTGPSGLSGQRLGAAKGKTLLGL